MQHTTKSYLPASTNGHANSSMLVYLLHIAYMYSCVLSLNQLWHAVMNVSKFSMLLLMHSNNLQGHLPRFLSRRLTT